MLYLYRSKFYLVIQNLAFIYLYLGYNTVYNNEIPMPGGESIIHLHNIHKAMVNIVYRISPSLYSFFFHSFCHFK